MVAIFDLAGITVSFIGLLILFVAALNIAEQF